MSENLDLFGNPITAPTPIVQSAKDVDDALKVVWRPYKGASMVCQDCAFEFSMGKRPTIASARHIRREGDDERLLCYPHKAERLDRDSSGRG